MRLYNINDNLIRTIECLYNKATSTVYHDNNIGECFRTTIGVRQGCLLSPTLFNIFLERIMADALEDHEDGLAGQEQELVKLVNHLEEASTAYGMQISAEKTRLMTIFFFGVPQLYLWGSPLLDEIFACVTVF